MAPLSVWTKRDLSPIWRNVSFKSFKEESEKVIAIDRKRSLLLSSAFITGVRVPLFLLILLNWKSESESHSVESESLRPHGLWLARLLCP